MTDDHDLYFVNKLNKKSNVVQGNQRYSWESNKVIKCPVLLRNVTVTRSSIKVIFHL